MSERNGCICSVTTPCARSCPCGCPIMSGVCRRCARYGSQDQRKAWAERLVAQEKLAFAAIKVVKLITEKSTQTEIDTALGEVLNLRAAWSETEYPYWPMDPKAPKEQSNG